MISAAERGEEVVTSETTPSTQDCANAVLLASIENVSHAADVKALKARSFSKPIAEHLSALNIVEVTALRQIHNC